MNVLLLRSVFPTGVRCKQFQVCASLGELDSEHGKESTTTSDLSSCVIMFLTTNHEVRACVCVFVYVCVRVRVHACMYVLHVWCMHTCVCTFIYTCVYEV